MDLYHNHCDPYILRRIGWFHPLSSESSDNVYINSIRCQLGEIIYFHQHPFFYRFSCHPMGSKSYVQHGISAVLCSYI